MQTSILLTFSLLLTFSSIRAKSNLTNFNPKSKESVFKQIDRYECGFSDEHKPNKKWTSAHAILKGIGSLFKKHPVKEKFNNFKRYNRLSRNIINDYLSDENSCENPKYLFQNTIKSFTPKFENSLTFNNHCPATPEKAIKSSGFCWGYAALEQRLLRLAVFAPEKASGYEINSREWVDYYEEKIKSILDNNLTIIPGFKNLREFSSYQKIEWMLKRFMIYTWTNEAHHFKGLKGSKFKGWSLETKKDFFNQTISLLDMGYTPLVLHAKSRYRKSSHVLVAWEYFKKGKTTTICMRDPNKTYLFDRTCQYKVTLRENEEDYQSVSSYIITHTQMRDFYWQYKSLKQACEQNKFEFKSIQELQNNRTANRENLKDNKKSLIKRIKSWEKYNNVRDLETHLLNNDIFLADLYLNTFATLPQIHPEVFNFKRDFLNNLVTFFNQKNSADAFEYLGLEPKPTKDNMYNIPLYYFLQSVSYMNYLKKDMEQDYSKDKLMDQSTVVGRVYSFLEQHLKTAYSPIADEQTENKLNKSTEQKSE